MGVIFGLNFHLSYAFTPQFFMNPSMRTHGPFCYRNCNLGEKSSDLWSKSVGPKKDLRMEELDENLCVPLKMQFFKSHFFSPTKKFVKWIQVRIRSTQPIQLRYCNPLVQIIYSRLSNSTINVYFYSYLMLYLLITGTTCKIQPGFTNIHSKVYTNCWI